ncbi:MAG: tetratricopeptide repeat protein [Oligoflexus sp.]
MTRNIRKNPKLELANKLVFVKEYKKAETLIEELLADPNFAEDLLVHLRRIELATKLDNVDKLHRLYQEKISRDVADQTAQIGSVLVELHGDLAPVKESILRLQALLGTYGPHPAIYYGLGFAMEVEANWRRAQYNYEQCVQLDPSWYPGYFGLSQIHYQLGDDGRGDHYFFLFEEAAPYNVYGNFETHRKLSHEFLDKEEYLAAERAISTLSEWWVDNKSHCPIEIQLYERFSLAKIAAAAGDVEQREKHQVQGKVLAKRILYDKDSTEGVLFFVARALEEHSEFDLAVDFYKAILRLESRSPEVIQRIGSQFFSMGEYQLASDLFQEAYKHHPDHPEVRFCWMVAKLRTANVNVEEYLIGKERLKSLLENPSDRVELLSLLHSLMAMYTEDPDVHAHMGDVYYRLGNHDRAIQHYEKMYDIDRESLVTRLKYASFCMQTANFDKAKQVLDILPEENSLGDHHLCEVLWLKANYASQQGHYDDALRLLNRVLAFDPWNVAYLIQKIICLGLKHQDKLAFHPVDNTIKSLSRGDESDLNWKEYDEITSLISQANLLELNYERERIRFLYAEGDAQILGNVIHSARRYDASKATYDFLRLLNTNFDSPEIYWALGMLFKELWQLETSRVWFEQMLLHPHITDYHKAKSYLEIADCYIWEGRELEKSVEFAKLALDLCKSPDQKAIRVLAHALLKRGHVRQAEAYLEDLEDEDDVEVSYIRGLVNYRNGAFEKANQIWKPLLTTRTESLRFHNIKQEIMKYYFDKKPYQSSN